MTTATQHYAPPGEHYSNLETVYNSPNSPPKADPGLQVHYGRGDEGYGAKEAYHHNEGRIAEGTGGWKKRRICGMSMIVFIIIVTIALVAAIVGGVVGGVLGSQKKDPEPATITASAPSASRAVSATAASISTSDSTASGTSSISAKSGTSTSGPYPTPGLPSDWWHSIENLNLAADTFALTNVYKKALGGNLKLQNYVEFVDDQMEQYYQHWQFYAITPKHNDSKIVRENPNGLTALYLLAARIPGQETLLVLNSDDYDTVTAATNTTAMNIRLDMKEDDGDLGKFWFVERTDIAENRVRIYNYKAGKKWWMAAEANAELGNEGVVYMTSGMADGSEIWFLQQREFIKPEYDWIV